MDQEKIGRFIASCRKEAGLTQAGLAEKLGITDRAVSKWENGRSMPDVSIMLTLCSLLGINVNELLSGEHLEMENYKEKAEENLLQLQKAEEEGNRKMLSMEVLIGVPGVAAYLVLFLAAIFAVRKPVWQAVMIITAFVTLAIVVISGLRIEHDSGYYECPNCGRRYVPSMKAVILAPHMGRDRKMRCPYCGNRGYHKKSPYKVKKTGSLHGFPVFCSQRLSVFVGMLFVMVFDHSGTFPYQHFRVPVEMPMMQ